MRNLLFLFLLITSPSFAISYPVPINSECVAACSIENNNCNLWEHPSFQQRYFPPGTGTNPNFGYLCPSVTCDSGFTFLNGFCTKPDNCSSGYTFNGRHCVNSQGCTVDQIFRDGHCIYSSLDQSVSNCLSLVGTTGVATLNVGPTGERTCIYGTPTTDTAAACQQADGSPCFAHPSVAEGQEGWQCGTFNGSPLCVSSASTGAIGVGSGSISSSTQTGRTATIEDVFNDGTFTTTTTKNVTPSTTTTTSIYDPSAPIKDGQQVDPGAGTAAPYRCSDGRLAANIASCDSAQQCPTDSYIAYGVCIKLPTVTTTTKKEAVTTDTVKRDNATGQIVTSSTVTSTTSSPVRTSNQSPTDEPKGECDPTSSNYQVCVGLLATASDGSISDHKSTLDGLLTSANQSTLQKATDAIRDTSGGLGVDLADIRSAMAPLFLPPTTCAPFVVQLGPYVSYQIECDLFNRLKDWLSWAMVLFTHLYLLELFLRPVK